MKFIIVCFMLLQSTTLVWADGQELQCFYTQNGSRVTRTNWTILIQPEPNTTIYDYEGFAEIPQGDPRYNAFESNLIQCDHINPDGGAGDNNYTIYYGVYKVTFLEYVNAAPQTRGTGYIDFRDANYYGNLVNNFFLKK